MTTDDVRAQILGVYVRRYKNLEDTWLPWHDGIAVFGANGTGKTNLFEALAVLLGAEDTVALASSRLDDVASGDLEVVIEVSDAELPLAPDVVSGAELDVDGVAQWPALVRPYLDAQWWGTVGVESGSTFLESIESLGLPEEFVVYLREQLARPAIRYTLTRANYVRLAVDEPNEPLTLMRHYGRTLLGAEPPKALAARAAELPDVFAPLRTALTSPQPATPSGLVDLMVLSGVPEAPVTLQWLPRARASHETDAELIGAFEAAYPDVARLVDAILGLGLVDLAEKPGNEAHWWLHEILAKAANGELASTMPDHIRVVPDGSDDADIRLIDSRSQGHVEVGRSGEETMLDRLSAGERRWVDEALATAARELRAAGEQARWHSSLLDTIDELLVLPALVGAIGEVQQLVDESGYFSAEALQLVQTVIEPILRVAAHERLNDAPDLLRRRLVENLYGLESLRPRTTVRLFDEPEAHLHPGAQRIVAAALETLRRAGDNVVIATHSPQFLDLPGWSLVHLQRTPEGSTLSPLGPGDLDARRSLAGQLGLTRGELLTRVNFILIVEGEGDRLVLETLYGAELDQAGVHILRMHGTANILATAELDFVDRYLNAPIGVLTDCTKIDRVNSSAPGASLSDEEKALRSLRRACRARGRTMNLFGLERPDITAYLSADALRSQVSGFPGWPTVLQRFREQDRRPSFKNWLHERFEVDLRHTGHIAEVLREMQGRDLPPEGDLPRVVQGILRTAVDGHWSTLATDARG